MSRKVFLSVLGTGNYSKCVYGKDSFKSVPTRYIQRATLDYLQNVEPWTENDAAFILTTQQAFRIHWLPFTTDEKNDCTVLFGLKDELDNQNYSFNCQQVDIPLGNNEKELWEIFETAFNLLEEGDDVYFDLTHAFRYQPMLMLVLGNYAKFLKHIKVRHISYGNYDGRDKDTGVAPINDLLPLSQLQDWTFAIAEYLEDGHSRRMMNLTKEELTPLLKETETRNTAAPLRKLSNALHDMCSEMEMCRGLKVVDGSTVQNLNRLINEIDNVVIPTMKPLLQRVQSDISDFSTKRDVRNMLAAARWCFDRQQYQQSITFLEEGVISSFCELCNIPIDDENKRGVVNSAFAITAFHIPEEQWTVKIENLPLLRSVIAAPSLEDKNLVKAYSQVVELRNDYNHCGMREKAGSYQKMVNKIDKAINSLSSLLFDDKASHNEDFAPQVFLNISNHPLEHWSEEQSTAAKQYGELKEMPFPEIAPSLSSEEIAEMAAEYYNMIVDRFGNSNLTVHIMGEMTFTYQLVSLLKERDIRCVASTTKRDVVEQGDKKISTFRFFSFREY